MKIASENIIIGSGIFGLSIAAHLSNLGQKVTVVDKSENPNEASSNALGRIDPILGGSGHGHETKPLPVAKKSLDAYKKFLNLDDETKKEIEFEIRPTIHFLEDDSQFKMIEDLIHQIDSERNFFSIQNMASIEIEKFINLSYFPSLSLFNGTIFINSKKYKTYLENECKKNGVNFIKDEIIDIHEIDNSPKLSGKYYSYAFEKLIVASGPWTKKLLGNSIKIDVYPSKGQIVKLRDPDNKFTDLHLHGSCSVIKKKDDLIWIAATSEEKGFDKTITNQAKDFLIDSAKKKPLILDVREQWEYDICHIENSVHIPMGKITSMADDLKSDEIIIVVCHHGIRSRMVAKYLVTKGFKDVINLTGGIDAWSSDVDPAMPKYV